MFLNVLGIIIGFVVVGYTYFKWKYVYWKRKGIPFLEPTIPTGNMSNPFTLNHPFTLDIAEIYKKLKSQGAKYSGYYMFNEPVYLPIDPEHLKSVMVKDFNHFVNRGVYFNEEIEPLSAHLFSIEDEKWRNLRARLTPTFTSGKMKVMFQTLLDCSVPFQKEIASLNEKGEELDIKELVAKFTTDVIGSCAFGIECNSFKDPNAEFRKYGKKIFEGDPPLKIIMLVNFPNFFKKFGIKTIKQDVSEFFLGMVEDTVKFREEKNFHRNDFMQLLVDLKNKGNEDKHDGTTLTLNEVAAQAFIFFLAGFETSSTTLTYCIYELCKQQEIQEKVREEIKKILTKYDGKITYEAIKDMKYTEQVLNETLRMYPPVPILNRICTQDYVIPGTDVVLEKGTKVIISAYGIHHDPEYYPEPEKFNPDRFSEENKTNLPPCTFIPFGEGPRICIGLRFGMMQAKVGLVTLLRDYKLTLSPKTPNKLSMNPKSFILANKETILIQSKKIK